MWSRPDWWPGDGRVLPAGGYRGFARKVSVVHRGGDGGLAGGEVFVSDGAVLPRLDAPVLIFAQPKSRREIYWWQAQEYLEHLTLKRRVVSSTMNQALSALQFLFRGVLRSGAGGRGDVKRPSQSQRLPTVLTREEVGQLLDLMEGQGRLMAEVMYGSGLRAMECVRLRIKDVDFGNRYIVVRAGKGTRIAVCRFRRGSLLD